MAIVSGALRLSPTKHSGATPGRCRAARDPGDGPLVLAGLVSGSAIPGGGIVLLDGAIFGAGAPTGDSVQLNRLSGNTPFDIYGDGSGSLNTVSGNSCHTTNLGGC